MYTPTKKQWNTVIDNLYKILPLTFEAGIGHLNMSEGSVNDEHTCGTVHCLGGWYAIAVFDTDRRKVTFREGANKMAEALGFNRYTDLDRWAALHPHIWGNGHGLHMFCSRNAYDYAESISDIIVFLEKVRDRSPDGPAPYHRNPDNWLD
jgi:hypothetical protein